MLFRSAPSVGDPAGERLAASDGGLPKISCAAAVSSETTAVVATALAAPAAPANGSRALENRDEEDIRDARDPDRSGRGAVLLCGVAIVCVGDGVGCGCGGGGAGTAAGTGTGGGEAGVCGLDGVLLSTEFSGGACASSRDRDDGPAVGAELPRARDARWLDVADGDGNSSSTSASGSGGPGVGSGEHSVAGGSDPLSDKGVFFALVRRFDVEDGCVQSSTSSM